MAPRGERFPTLEAHHMSPIDRDEVDECVADVCETLLIGCLRIGRGPG